MLSFTGKSRLKLESCMNLAMQIMENDAIEFLVPWPTHSTKYAGNVLWWTYKLCERLILRYSKQGRAGSTSHIIYMFNRVVLQRFHLLAVVTVSQSVGGRNTFIIQKVISPDARVLVRARRGSRYLRYLAIVSAIERERAWNGICNATPSPSPSSQRERGKGGGGSVQSWGVRWALGCMNSRPAARERFTQPRSHLIAHLCTTKQIESCEHSRKACTRTDLKLLYGVWK